MAATAKQLAALKKARAARAKTLAKKKTAPKRKAPAKKRPTTKYVMTVLLNGNVIGFWHNGNWDDKAATYYSSLASLKKALPAAKKATPHTHGIGYKPVKKSSAGRGRKANPVPASKAYKAKQAIALYEDFTGHPADYYQNIPMEWPDVGLKVGECDGILYSTVRDGVPEKYIHKFKKSARPVLVADHDGSQLALIGGNFDFTPRGIVDK